jgi:hypothetical protein
MKKHSEQIEQGKHTLTQHLYFSGVDGLINYWREAIHSRLVCALLTKWQHSYYKKLFLHVTSVTHID